MKALFCMKFRSKYEKRVHENRDGRKLIYDYGFRRRDIIALWDFLKHGDTDHELWLLDAIEAFFEHRQRPPPR